MTLTSAHSRLTQVARVAAIAGGLGIIFISLMVTLDVLMRKFFGTTLGGATEISGFVFAVGTAFAYPYVLLDRANVRIDVIYTHVGARTRAILDLVALLLLLFFVAVLTKSVYGLLMKSWSLDSKTIGVVHIPLWIPQALWVLGYALLTLTAVFLTVCVIVGFVRRDWASVSRVAGIPSIEETIEEETHIDAALVDDAAARSGEELK